MQNKIKLFLYRYGLTILYVLSFFFIIYALNKMISLLFSHRLYCCIILALNIRILDDFFDYDYDVILSKVLFSKRTLAIMYVISVIANIILGIIFKDILLLVLIFLINGICMIKKYEYLKILVMPLFMVYAIYTLDITVLNIILIVISVVLAILYFLIKRRIIKIFK